MTETLIKDKWAGEFVSDRLNVTIDNRPEQILNIEDTVGLALRNNPKRAHLLVSKLLGKHIPASPSLVNASGQLLGALAYEALGGNLWSLRDNYCSIQEALKSKTKGAMQMQRPLNKIKAITIGYAETATSLGYIVANYLESPYIHSTRYGREGIVPYGAFEEAHSHATSHKLMPVDPLFLQNDLPLVLVDDEMSTGKTIIATIEELHALSPRKHYVVCSLIDCRSAEDRARMDKFAVDLGIQLDVVALSYGEVLYPDTILEDVKPVIKEIHTEIVPIVPDLKGQKRVEVLTGFEFEGFEHARYGIEDASKDDRIAASIAHELSGENYGRTLVLGTEEFMYLPLQTAKSLEFHGFDVYTSSTTRSPVIPFIEDEYAVRTKLTYFLPDGDERYLYNAEGFDTIIVIVEPGKHYTEYFAQNGLVQALETTSARKITIIQGDTNVR